MALKIRSCVKLEQLTDLKMKTIREANLPLTNNEAIQNMLKGNNKKLFIGIVLLRYILFISYEYCYRLCLSAI